MTFPAKHISVSINRPMAEVYGFLAKPENFPQWAEGLGGSLQKIGGEWVAQSPMGTIKVNFSPTNDFGIVDHDVTLPNGETVHNPMRVCPNHNGSEVVFTLFRRPEMSEKEYDADSKAVANDLAKLKKILEN